VDAARREVQQAEAELLEIQRRLTIYRNSELLVDPTKNSAAILDTIGVLTKELAQASARLAEVEATTPQSPTRQGLRAQLTALQEQIARQRNLLAGDDKALAANLSQYERLVLERDLADKRLGGATTAYIAAQQEAQRKQIYIERIVNPNLPDESTEPLRLRAVATTAVVCFTFFAVMWILVVGAREHAQ
jgi:capsular polysaccharide transport system permease protein